MTNENLFNKCRRGYCIFTYERMKWFIFYTNHKITLILIKVLKVRSETIKLRKKCSRTLRLDHFFPVSFLSYISLVPSKPAWYKLNTCLLQTDDWLESSAYCVFFSNISFPFLFLRERYNLNPTYILIFVSYWWYISFCWIRTNNLHLPAFFILRKSYLLHLGYLANQMNLENIDQ